MRRLLFFVAVSLALLSAPAFASAPLPDPCSLLTDAQVAPAVGGTVQTHKAVRNSLYRMCTWTGAPMGYMQSSTQLIVQVDRQTKSQFLSGNRRSKPVPTAVRGLGTLAFSSIVGLSVWKDGIAVELDGPWLGVYPTKGVLLAKKAVRTL